MIFMEKSEDEGFDSSQQEMEAAETEEIDYLKSYMVDFSIKMHILVNKVGSDRMNTDYSKFFRIVGVNGDELDITGFRSTNTSRSKFVLMMNDQFPISKSQI
ncbi:hypothetical protein AVEN_32670-1 [Araneus ventricosus]|uniref:Uncharacterized protein n=1 Tax=Araneus ventricosus TaxID=182803 RepID=A0A4Y2C7E6_ARAVE|nr:hypothetical protein AVEN_32670-1 [Araneus ventricosus]